MIGTGFIVIGVNRSGTSAVAAALKRLGVYFGRSEDNLISGPDIDYDSCENRHIIEIGATVLRALESDGVPARGMQAGWSEIADVSDRVPEVAKFVDLYFGSHRTWGWKDPRTSLLIPFFERVFELIGIRPTYLMPIRHPLEVAAGLQKRQGLSRNEAIGFWIHYTISALSELDAERTTVLPFSEFVADPRRFLEPVWAAQSLEPPKEADWSRVRETVQLPMYRTRECSQELPPFASKVWDFVRSLTTGTDWRAGSEGREIVDGLAAEWHEWSELTRLPSVPIGEVRWSVCNRMSSLPFRGDAEWHRCVIPLDSGARGSVDLWFLPSFRTVRLRKLEFSPKSDEKQSKVVVGDSAFAEVAERGELKLHVFGPTPHLSLEIPRDAAVRELRFEFQVSTGKQAVTDVAQRLASAHSSLWSTATTAPRRR